MAWQHGKGGGHHGRKHAEAWKRMHKARPAEIIAKEKIKGRNIISGDCAWQRDIWRANFFIRW